MKINILDNDFSICKIENSSDINLQQSPIFVAITNEEISIVCETKSAPANALDIENNWKALKIEGILDFSLVGILSKISTILADNQISVFVISTYNTDYILVKSDMLNQAVNLLQQNNYQFVK